MSWHFKFLIISAGLPRDRWLGWTKFTLYYVCIYIPYCSSKEVTVLHHAHCYLPSLAAYALARDPQLVSAACHALSDRSPADMQVCRKMAVFSPTKHAVVMARVRFTRLLYAQLLRMQFSGAKNSGFSVPSPQSARFKECDLGMKLVWNQFGVVHKYTSTNWQPLSVLARLLRQSQVIRCSCVAQAVCQVHTYILYIRLRWEYIHK